MAIETLGAALRQINRLFAEGVVAGLSDAQLLERFLTQKDAGAFEVLVGRHGPMVLSVCRGDPARSARRRGRLPGDLPGPGQEGPDNPGTRRLGGLAAPGRASRRDPGQHRRGPAARARKAGGTDGRRDLNERAGRPRMICCRRCTRRSPGLPEKIPARRRPLRPGRHDPGAGRRVNCTGANGRSDRRLAEGRERLKAPTRPTRPGTRRRHVGAVLPPRGAGRRTGGLERSDRPCGAGHRRITP